MITLRTGPRQVPFLRDTICHPASPTVYPHTARCTDCTLYHYCTPILVATTSFLSLLLHGTICASSQIDTEDVMMSLPKARRYFSRERYKPKTLYLCAIPQRDAWGDARASIPAYVTGKVARRDLLELWSGPLPSSPMTFRLQDGHLPECQPQTDFHGVVDFLEREPFQAAYVVFP